MPLLRHISLMLSVLAASACSVPQAPAPEGLHDDGLHALMVGELDHQLTRLQALSFELHLTPAELERLQAQRARAIAASASRLDVGAQAVLALEPTLPLPDASRARFRELAGQLQDAAHSITQQAQGHDLSAFESNLSRLRATCDSCHALFRAP